MKKIALTLLTIFSLFVISCEIGLGSAVDTEPPSLEIITPPIDSVIRDSFAISGEWSDDGKINSVVVKLERTDGVTSSFTYNAEVIEEKVGKGKWKAIIDPVTENVVDGSYQATVTITDATGRKTIRNLTFGIDNTAPLIVLQRPGTKISETPDAYGQTFSLNGMGGDDNSIDHIDVNIYSDADCKTLLKTITKNNVAPTIELDVAVFEENVENDYATIYGSKTKNGTQTRYCTITAYDNAKQYSVEYASDPVNENGNSTSVYYLYDDIYSGILENYTITEIYKMLSGNYLLTGQNRSAEAVINVKTLLEQHKMSESNFSLNPENNPLFIVNGKDVLTQSGNDFAGSDYNISNGSSVVVEVSTGLDGISLKAASLRPYLLPCDTYGKANVEDIPANRIYLTAAGAGAKSGTSYKFTVTFDTALTYENNKKLIIGNSYIFGVEGSDQRGNTVIPKGGSYGFKLSSNGAAPGLTITVPSAATTYVKANGNQNFEGVVTSQDGFPTITIKDGSTVVYTHTFTEQDLTVVNGVRSFTFSTNIDYTGQENRQIQYTITASQEALDTTAFKTVIYDKDAPTVSVDSLLPEASKYDIENEDSPLVGESYLNGEITIKASLNDEFDAIDMNYAEGSTSNNPYFEIIDDSGNKLPVQVTGDVRDISATDKHYITKLINGNFKIDTTAIPANTNVKFKFFAWDRAGNPYSYVYPTSSYYIVDQTTDAPVVLPDDSETSLKFTSKALRDAAAGNYSNTNRIRRSQVSSGGTILVKMLDDDGISEYKIYLANLSTSNQTELADDVSEGRFSIAYEADNLTNKEIVKSITVPTPAGYYWYKIWMKDKNNNETTRGPFIIKVTTAAPSITVTALDSNAVDTTDTTVGKFVGGTGSAKTSWMNKIEIDSSENSFKLWRAKTSNENVEPDSSTYTEITAYTISGNTKILYDKITPSNVNGDEIYYYYVSDTQNGTESTAKKIVCKYDGTAPVLSISSPGTGDTAKTGQSAINSSPYQFSGKIIETNTIAATYYKIVAADNGSYTAPVAPANNLMTTTSWVSSGWTFITPETDWSFVRNINEGNSTIAEGKYKIYMYALDGAGNLSDLSSQEFHVDMAAPVVTASAPEYVAKTTSDNRKVTIIGTVVESHGLASFYIKRNGETGNGTSVTSDDSGNWTYTNTPTADGTYTYTITATDLVGKTNTSLTKTVIVDTVIPTVDATKLVTPTSTQTESTLFKFEGSASCVADNAGGSGLEKVEIAFTSNTTAPATAQATVTPAANGSWNSTVEFANAAYGNVFSTEGTKYLWVKVYDKAGNSSAWTSKSFEYDKTAPEISFTATSGSTNPAANTYRNSGFKLEVSASDDYGIQDVKINYGSTTVDADSDGNGKYSKTFKVGEETTVNAVSIDDGTYTFTITATDLSGKSKSVTRSFTIDTTKPKGTFVPFSPEGNTVDGKTWYKSDTIRFALTVEDDNIDTVTISCGSSEEQMMPKAGVYTGTIDNLSEGQNTVSVVMKDLAGNTDTLTTTDVWDVWIDTNAPVLTPDESTILTYMGENGFEVTGSTYDSLSGVASLKVKEEHKGTANNAEWAETTASNNGGVSIRVTSNSWRQSLPLNPNALEDGYYRYTFILEDNAGNKTSKQYETTVDTKAPTISITNPGTGTAAKTGDNSINNSPYQFSGTITEVNTIHAVYYKVIQADSNGTYTAPVVPTPQTGKTLMDAVTWAGWTSVTPELGWSFTRNINTGLDDAIAEGKYKIYMYALDGAGNLSDSDSTTNGAQPYSREFHVDMAAPVVTASAPEYVAKTTSDNRKVTITGTVVESHGLASFYIKRNDENENENGTSVSPKTDGSWTYTNTPTADGTYTYTITATDLVGKTNTSLTKTVIVDTVIPTVDATKLVTPTSTQTESTLFKFEGSASCVADNAGGSGLEKVEIAFTSNTTAPAAAQATVIPAANGSWNSTVEFANAAYGNVFSTEGTKYLWVKVYDKAGNSSAWISKNFTYDKAAPEISFTATSGSTNPAANSYRNSGFALEVEVSDDYGIQTVEISDGTNSYTLTETSTGSGKYAKTFRVGTETGTETLLAEGSYTFTVTATDLSGKSTSVNRTITIDREKPNLDNIKLIVDVINGKDVEAYRESETDPYYVNNVTSKSLKISGVATDNIGVANVTVSIPDSGYTGKYSGSVSQWKFENINLSGMSNKNGQDATATVTVTDLAGNINTGIVNIYFDTTGPEGYHEVDSKSKDLFFRMGDNDNDDITKTANPALWNDDLDTDVGKKYSDKTYGNSDTIEIRGKLIDSQKITLTDPDDQPYTVTEPGSGVKMIYYYVFDKPVVLGASYTDKEEDTVDGVIVNGESRDNVDCYGFKDKTSLTDWVIANKKGNFEPGSTETKRVFYNVNGSDLLSGFELDDEKYYKNVDTNYRATLSGFENSNNFLVIAAVDNVGNKGLDFAIVENEDKVFCQINKDVTPPNVMLDEDEESMRFHNASATGDNIVFNGTVTDDLAGIKELKFRVNGKYIPNEEENQSPDKYGTISNNNYTDDTKTSGTWTLTIKPAALTGTSDNISVYGIATDSAGLGNSQTLSIATICVDVTPPTVKITPPKDRGSAEGTQINGIISLSGTASDRNGLKEETGNLQTMKLYYTTKADLSTTLTNALDTYNLSPTTATYPTLSTGADAASAWKEIKTAVHDTSWTFTGIDTSKLDGSTPIADTTTVYFTVAAIDKAGNTGYAAPVTVIVDQNTDRPTISFSNLDLGTTMSNSEDGYIWLKNTTKIIGTVEDDDDSEDGTNTVEISLTGSDSDWHTVTLNGSSFNYDLKNLYTATATQTQEQLVNRKNTIYLKVTDKKGKTFKSATTNSTSALYLSDGTNIYGNAEQAGSIVYVKVDTIYPEVALQGAKYAGDEDTTYSTSYSSFVIGETHKAFKVKFTASDSNGIDESTESIKGTAEFPYGTGAAANKITINATALTKPTSTAAYYTLTFTLSDAQAELLKENDGYTDSVNVRISVNDMAGNTTPQTATMTYDFKPAVASFSSPDSSTTLSGEVEAYGSLSELTSSVSYKITPSFTANEDGSYTPTAVSWTDGDNNTTNFAIAKTVEGWKSIDDATGLSWTIHFDNVTGTSGTHSKSLNKYLIDYGIAAQDTSSQAADAIVSSFDKFVKLYLWIKTVDHAGNEKTFMHPILVDPQGDRPTLQFSYPAASNGTLGGEVSIYGTATDTKGTVTDNIGVDSVWVQIKSTTHRAAEDTTTYGTSPTYDSATGVVSMILKKEDLNYMATNGYTVYKWSTYKVGVADYDPNHNYTEGEYYNKRWDQLTDVEKSSETADNWAAIASLNGAAWDISINKTAVSGLSEFDPPSGTDTNPIAIRVFARDKDKKPSIKVDRYVSFDADTPIISDLKLVQSADGKLSSAATATKTYTADMYVKEKWYLIGTVTDKDKIKELKVNGETLVKFTETESAPNPDISIEDGWADAVSITNEGKSINFKYPLATDTADAYDLLSFRVEAKDGIKGNNAHTGTAPISINYDNKKPTIATSVSEGFNISTSIQQSNKWYTFGSKAMEASADETKKQSGFAYTAFYFTRSSTNMLYNILNTRESSIDISGTFANLGTEAPTSADNTIVKNNELYWYRKTISNVSGQSFNVTDATGIRGSSLIQIKGALYLVTSVSGTSITVDSPIPTDAEVAYVAIAGIINNTTPEGDGTAIQSDGYYENPSRDDGDRMIESVDKSGTTWAWEAKICSRNIPDGPVVLHYIVFDKAGNSTTSTVSGMISNNQPRIAGAIVKTDFNGDGDVEDDGEEIKNYSIARSYKQYFTGPDTEGLNTEVYDSSYLFDPDSNVKNTNAKNPLPTSATYGSATEPVTVLRGRTIIQPEIVGGNGALYYGYKIGNATTFTNNTTTPFILEGSTDYTVNEGNINIQVGDLISFGETTNATTGKAFTFKFWDSTEGGVRFNTTNPTQTAELTMYFAVQAQAVGTPSVKIKPFYWKGLKDNSIYGSSTASSYSSLQGHIELEADWKTTSAYNSAATSGLYDDDPKVSGKIVLSGTAHDDKLIKEMKVSIFGGTAVQVANYANGGLASTKLAGAFDTNHYWFEVVDQTINSSGHDVNWKLYIDTATALSDVAGTDKTVTVTATNYGVPTATSEGITSETPGALPGISGTTYYAANLTYGAGNSNTPGTTQTGKTKDAQNNTVLTAYYKMDVVPYITKISTTVRTASGLKDNNIRSASGKYSILANNTANTITVNGFNFAAGNKLVAKIAQAKPTNSPITPYGPTLVATTADTANTVTTSTVKALGITQSSETSATITNSGITKSGYLELFSNGIRALNNINSNDSYGSYSVTGKEKVKDDEGNETDEEIIFATVSDYDNAYNREPDYYTTKNVQLTDDRYLRFFDMKDTGIKNGYYPVMMMGLKTENQQLVTSDNPVFGYVDLNGMNNSVSTFNCYTLNKPQYMVQRAEFSATTGKTSDIEYLIGGMTWDQMAMSRDTKGKYMHVSVFNQNSSSMTFVYDRFAEITYSNRTGYYDGWGGGSAWTNWINAFGGTNPTNRYNQSTQKAVNSENNAINMETTGFNEKSTTEESNLVGRYQGMKMKTTGDSTNGNGAINYLAYYDDNTANSNIIFRTFRVRTQANNSLGNAMTGGLSSNLTDGDTSGRITAASNATKYLDLGVTSDGYAVIVYYDKDGKLRLVHSDAAVTGAITGTTFSAINVNFTSYIGQYVSMAIDSSDHIHIAAFDANKSTLRYIYLDDYNDKTPDEYTVDASTSVGKWTQIKIHNGKPYIAYYNNAEDGQKESIRLAYLSKATVADGYDSNGYATGAWEYMTVPSLSPAQGGDTKFQAVCLDFDSSGRPVVGYLGTNLEFGKWLDE